MNSQLESYIDHQVFCWDPYIGVWCGPPGLNHWVELSPLKLPEMLRFCSSTFNNWKWENEGVTPTSVTFYFPSDVEQTLFSLAWADQIERCGKSNGRA